MSDEWGPWIKHDGKGCPCVGAYGRVELEEASARDSQQDWVGLKQIAPCVGEGILFDCDAWYSGPRGQFYKVEFYQIRKPKGLTILEGLLQDQPEPVA